MKYFVDGFMIGKNPSPYGGGFTVVNEQNELVKHHVLDWKHGELFTNNHAEILAIAYAAHIAQTGDGIVTDSQAAYYWTKNGFCTKRPDLSKIAAKAHHWVWKKRLRLEWLPRTVNLAGHYNEQHPYHAPRA